MKAIVILSIITIIIVSLVDFLTKETIKSKSIELLKFQSSLETVNKNHDDLSNHIRGINNGEL